MQEALAHGRCEIGIDYEWLGRELGGYRRGGYEAHTETEQFRQGIRRIISLTEKGRVAILCAERDPVACHRRYIASYLASLGVRVIHIVGPGKTTEAQIKERRASSKLGRPIS